MFIQSAHEGRLRLVTSPSDLTAASACEFAFLRRVDLKLGRDVVVPAQDDAMLERAARLGDAHEERVLAAYRATHTVAEIARVSPPSPERLDEAQRQTLAALRGEADVVFQATFFDRAHPLSRGITLPDDLEIGFVGYADFLVRGADGAFEVQDAKLARRAKVTALMQLAAYAEQLERLGVAVSPVAALLLGDGARSEYRLADIAPVFRSRRDRLYEILIDRARATGPDGQRESAAPVAWGSDDVVACGVCEVCEPEVQRTRDPLLTAGIRRSQRRALAAAGITTIDDVAALERHPREVPGIAPVVLGRLVSQAAVQLESEESGKLAVRVADATALLALPEPNPGDLFFDFEGDPLYREDAGTGADAVGEAHWGLDYLFGMVDVDEQFSALWAHDLAAERRALETFIAFVKERRQRYPNLKIYHYASYERTHLLSIAARHGTAERDVDELLREHVLVDLYPIVRQALRVGSRSYSIKKLEPLYMGAELRDEDGVTSGAESVTEYAEAMELLRSPDAHARQHGQEMLDGIADYNRYDCVSTLRLRDWLLGIARAQGKDPVPGTLHTRSEVPIAGPADTPGGAPNDPPNVSTEPSLELSPTAAELLRLSTSVTHVKDQRAAALGSSAVDYYQREQKAFWWQHYARLVDPIEDWADGRDVLVIDQAASMGDTDWHRPPRARSDKRTLRLAGELAPGSALRVDADVYLLYASPAPFTNPGAQPGARAVSRAKIVGFDGAAVIVDERFPAGAGEYRTLPVAMVPGPPPPTDAMKRAIEDWGGAFARHLAQGTEPRDPVVDVLRRSGPRFREADSGTATDLLAQTPTVSNVADAVRALDRSALAVQGPPGTGKTYLAARVIADLVVRDGWHIGVVAQSHRVVENVLDAVVAVGLPAAQVGKALQRGADNETPPAFTVFSRGGQPRFIDGLRAAGRGSVTGGTVWDFANAGRYPQKSLDLLVIDEAGQFALAPTIAASMAADRLLLLGDPQQLPQVSQGTHPEPVDTSALGWVIGEHDTLPPELGFFLPETRRMHPALAEIVSELSYEGRLSAHATAAERNVPGVGPPGLHWHPVEHEGNSTHSREEAREVASLVARLLGSPDAHLTESDLIVVAAYNAQVECVREELEDIGVMSVRVGTVDRFQGQEAAIAIVTLAATSPEEIPRGLEFLLMRNRLNVAISRAQWAAHLVSSTRLGTGLPSTVHGLLALSGYVRLTERGSVGAW